MVNPVSKAIVSVSAWDPGYGTNLDFKDFGDSDSVEIDDSVEYIARDWRGIETALPSDPLDIFFIDGIQRIEARLEIFAENDVVPRSALLGAVGAGVVHWDRRLMKSRFKQLLHQRLVVLPVGLTPETLGSLDSSLLPFEIRHSKGSDFSDLQDAMQKQMSELEVSLAKSIDYEPGSLVIADGRVRRDHPVFVVGYIKSNERQYLSGKPAEVVPEIKLGQRTPIFRIEGSFPRFSWYIRVGDIAGGHGWQGVARLEVSAQLSMDEVASYAAMTTEYLPIAAPPLHLDPRAPQNLIPIGALERELRRGLGDAELVNRKLREAVYMR